MERPGPQVIKTVGQGDLNFEFKSTTPQMERENIVKYSEIRIEKYSKIKKCLEP